MPFSFCPLPLYAFYTRPLLLLDFFTPRHSPPPLSVSFYFISFYCHFFSLSSSRRRWHIPRAAFRDGKASDAFKVLQQLTNNAINENRFNDASYYCWTQSLQCLALAAASQATPTGADNCQRSEMVHKYHHLSKEATIYYIYHNIHRYIVRLIQISFYVFSDSINN